MKTSKYFSIEQGMGETQDILVRLESVLEDKQDDKQLAENLTDYIYFFNHTNEMLGIIKRIEDDEENILTLDSCLKSINIMLNKLFMRYYVNENVLDLDNILFAILSVVNEMGNMLIIYDLES